MYICTTSSVQTRSKITKKPLQKNDEQWNVGKIFIFKDFFPLTKFVNKQRKLLTHDINI